MTTDFEILRGLPDTERREILASCTPRRYKRREILCHEGDPGDCLHLIKSGRLIVRVATPSGDIATLTMLGPGYSFGELAVLDSSSRRTATVEAVENVETLTFGRAQLTALRQSYPEIDRVMIDTLAAQVRRLSAQVLEALYLPVETRVVRRLIDLAHIYGGSSSIAEIRLNQEDLASMAGTTRATANKVLRDLQQRNILALTRGRITVVDRAELVRSAR
ncbi:Crp/Fnr family transcriptional regulator [Nocardia jinanensis]|uniref:Crp/Fnr family transcriptional regulator n=1 Tax=Nocardia jinanensis TaxID=382504 RepID=A0A917RDN0_9NOCA|nr:Crp/Fnr family transcriptional regulator [Nocardia jinanensis]GGL03230.1 Crp/Fnr family transcriptional regulator [Nocardia jinanensis]